LPVEWLETLDKQEASTVFPVTGKALWEEDEDKKPFYMQAAVPESRYDWPKLSQVAEKWTQAEPQSSEAWLAYGIGLKNTGKLDAAATAYKQAISLDASNLDAFINLGEMAKNRGDIDEMHQIQLTVAKLSEDAAAEYSYVLGCEKAC
jgi:cytochrome c-type biogenesis protein CcmH/NrfG